MSKQTKREAEMTDCLLTMVGILADRMEQVDALKAERRELRGQLNRAGLLISHEINVNHGLRLERDRSMALAAGRARIADKRTAERDAVRADLERVLREQGNTKKEGQ